MGASAFALALLLATGYDAVRGLPCTTHEQETAILATLREAPMTAESYGVVRNIVAPRPGDFLPRGFPEGWAYAAGDDWHAAQAFIVELSPAHETDGAMVFSETFFSISNRMYDLERMLATMRPHGTNAPFPYTAFLALAGRVANEPAGESRECGHAADATRLLQIFDHAHPEPRLHGEEDCRAVLGQFRTWLDEHSAELEAGAAKEADAIAGARERMNAVSLCRP